jgi:hypothetical protein
MAPMHPNLSNREQEYDIMIELIYLSHLRTEVQLRGDEGTRFESQCATRFVPWIMSVTSGPALESSEASMLPHELLPHANARTVPIR